ncbi:MAG TPA: hypothetical protein VHJ59_04915 [Nitrososphaera sp.]|jgi:hypothetical protein|nr:hypothetical protein [Nitrososphaera sp.]
MSKKQNETLTEETKGQVTKKSGKGNNHGFVSEVSAYMTVKPGHEEEARAACHRFGEMLRNSDPKEVQKTGLRDARLVVFDDGRRLMFASGFETEWDPYVDDAILIVGIQHFLDWMQHTVEAEELVASVKSLNLDQNDPAFAEKVKPAGAQLKAVIQSIQTPATAYFNALSDLTVPQIKKAQRLQQAFQQVLDDPAAQEALQHPALKPLLEQAAD